MFKISFKLCLYKLRSRPLNTCSKNKTNKKTPTKDLIYGKRQLKINRNRI